MDLTNKIELLNYLRQHNLWAKKGLSQNFLVDRNVLEKIVEAAEITKDDLIVEIGPGLGVLTEELIKQAGEVLAIEMDAELAKILTQQYCHSRFHGNLGSGSRIKSGMTIQSKFKLVNADILQVNLDELISDREYKVVANIPYAITSKILELFLSRENKPESIVMLVQKEVAERICAKPGEQSTLSVSVQFYGEPKIVEIVKASSFFPAPKVDSAIIKIENIHTPSTLPLVKGEKVGVDEKEFFRTVHIGFASRRKTLINNLSAGLQIDKKISSDIIKSVGLNENSRAQELSIDDWKKLSDRIKNL